MDRSAAQRSITAALALVGLGTLSATLAKQDKLRTTLAASLLLGMLALVTYRLLGHQLFPIFVGQDPRYSGFMAATLLLSVVGLWRGWLVAHWMSLGLAAAGFVSSSLNVSL